MVPLERLEILEKTNIATSTLETELTLEQKKEVLEEKLQVLEKDNVSTSSVSTSTMEEKKALLLKRLEMINND